MEIGCRRSFFNGGPVISRTDWNSIRHCWQILHGFLNMPLCFLDMNNPQTKSLPWVSMFIYSEPWADLLIHHHFKRKYPLCFRVIRISSIVARNALQNLLRRFGLGLDAPVLTALKLVVLNICLTWNEGNEDRYWSQKVQSFPNPLWRGCFFLPKMVLLNLGHMIFLLLPFFT